MLSFDITDRNIKIIKGSENNGKIRINAAATLNLEEEVIVNGHVKDVPRLAMLINQVLKANKMNDKEAIVSISSNLTIFKELHIPKAKESEFMKMVRAEMQSALGIDESYSVSYIVVGDVTDENGETAQKVLATACPYEVVDCYKRVFTMLAIPLRSVMVGCNCITKVLLSDAKIKSKMPLLAVQIDNNFISLNLYERGQLTFSRFASISAEDYGDDPDYVFEAVKENVFRMLQFQKSRNANDPIENVVLYGDTHDYNRLTDSLSDWDIKTSIINVPPQIHGYENLEFSAYANAIGAMYKRNKETERINLLETDSVNNNRVKNDKSFGMMLLGAVLGSMVLVGGVWFALNVKNNNLIDDIQEIQDKIDSPDTKAKIEQKERLLETEKLVNQYLDEVTDANQAYMSRPYLLAEDMDLLETTIAAAASEAGVESKILSFDYSGGAITLNIESSLSKKKEDMTEKFPALAAQKLSELSDDIYYVEYMGYSKTLVYDEVTNELLYEPKTDEEGNETKYSKATFTLIVNMKGDGVELRAAEAEEEEAE